MTSEAPYPATTQTESSSMNNTRARTRLAMTANSRDRLIALPTGAEPASSPASESRSDDSMPIAPRSRSFPPPAGPAVADRLPTDGAVSSSCSENYPQLDDCPLPPDQRVPLLDFSYRLRGYREP